MVTDEHEEILGGCDSSSVLAGLEKVEQYLNQVALDMSDCHPDTVRLLEAERPYIREASVRALGGLEGGRKWRFDGLFIGNNLWKALTMNLRAQTLP